MSQANLIQTNFTSGEISPSMYGRIDVAKYANGAAMIENMLVKPQGGLYRRMGTKSCGVAGPTAGAGSFSYDCALIPFIFNTTQSYVLEFTHLKMYVWKDDVAQASGGSKVAVVTPYYGIHVRDLKFCQSADTLFIFHPYYPPYKVTRDFSENFTITLMDFIDGPYLATDESKPVQLLSYSHTGRLTRSAGSAISFVIGDVNKYVEYNVDGVYHLAKITAYVSATVVDVEIQDAVLADFDSRTKIRIKGTGNRVWDPVNGHWIARQPVNTRTGERYMPPAAGVSVATGVATSNFAGTFTRGDIGKFIRGNSGAADGKWYQITGFTSDTTVNCALKTYATSWPVGTYPTDQLTLSNELRPGRLTVATGTNHFQEPSPLSTNTSGASTANVGRHFRLNFGGTQVWGKLTAVVGGDTNSFDVNLLQDPPRNPNDSTEIFGKGVPDSWRLGAWCGLWSTDDFWGTGYPAIGVFHEQRLVTARSLKEPQSIWMSRSAVYNDHGPTEQDSSVQDDNGIAYTLVSRRLNRIEWIESGPTLLIGTSGEEWQVKAASSIAAPLTPTNISVTPQSSAGTIARAHGHRVNSAVLFVNRSGRKVLHMQYNFELDQFVAKDLTILSDHILAEGGTRGDQTTYQQEPHSLFWVARQDGKLVCLTYQPDQEVYAFTKHYIGGTTSTAAKVESLTSIPNSTGTEDYVYMVVSRTINGVFCRFIERFAANLSPSPVFDDQKNFLDAYKDFTSGSPTTAVTGMTHLAGETVHVWADGLYVGTKVVTVGGGITLAVAASAVRVGYCATATVKTLRPEAPQPQGTSQGKTKRIHSLSLRLQDTYNFKIGTTASDLVTLDVTRDTGLETTLAALYTGDRIFSPEQPWSTDSQLLIVQDLPYNLHLVSVMPVVTVNS